MLSRISARLAVRSLRWVSDYHTNMVDSIKHFPSYRQNMISGRFRRFPTLNFLPLKFSGAACRACATGCKIDAQRSDLVLNKQTKSRMRNHLLGWDGQSSSLAPPASLLEQNIFWVSLSLSLSLSLEVNLTVMTCHDSLDIQSRNKN